MIHKWTKCWMPIGVNAKIDQHVIFVVTLDIVETLKFTGLISKITAMFMNTLTIRGQL